MGLLHDAYNYISGIFKCNTPYYTCFEYTAYYIVGTGAQPLKNKKKVTGVQPAPERVRSRLISRFHIWFINYFQSMMFSTMKLQLLMHNRPLILPMCNSEAFIRVTFLRCGYEWRALLKKSRSLHIINFLAVCKSFMKIISTSLVALTLYTTTHA